MSLRRTAHLPVHSPAGFTLVEMLVVLAMMSVVAMAILPLSEIANTRWKERELRTALHEIRTAIDEYKRLTDRTTGDRTTGDRTTGERAAAGSGYPPTLQALLEGVPARDSAQGSAPRPRPLLRRIPRDPFAPDGVPAERSWGLRSYDSPAHTPRPGVDVYDVYSLSPRMGSNGIWLRQW